MATILHTNDLHGGVGILPWLVALIGRERERDPAALLIDAGDTALRGPMAALGVRLLATLGYDAMTPGNAETDLVEDRVALGQVGAPIVVANVAEGGLGCPSIPVLVREVGGLRLGLLGLTTTPVYPLGHPLHRPGADEVPVGDALATATRWVPILRDQADAVVVISHLGLRRDLELAKAVPGIDLIVGGHSHHRLPSLLRVGATYIAQAGASGAYLGVVTIDRESQGLRLSGRLEPVWQGLAPDEPAMATTAAFLDRQMPLAREQIGATTGCWADPRAENAWSNFVLDAIRAVAGTEIALYNAGGILPALDPGPLRLWDLWRAMPAMVLNQTAGLGEIVRLTLTGADLRAVCEHSVSGLAWDLAPSVPPAFCQPGNAFLQSAGLRLRYDLTRPAGQRVVSLETADGTVGPGRRYGVAVAGFLAKGYAGYRWLRGGEERETVGAERDILAGAIRQGATFVAPDGRLQLMAE